jgi:hypothetical protein
MPATLPSWRLHERKVQGGNRGENGYAVDAVTCMILLKVTQPMESSLVHHSGNCLRIGSALFVERKNIGSPQNELVRDANGLDEFPLKPRE